MPGAELDLDLGFADVMIGLKAELSKMNDRNARMDEHRRREAARARVPSMVRMFSSATIPAAAPRTGISLDGPSAGFYWMLRRLIVGGVTWKTTAAGTAEVYVTGLGGAVGQAVTGAMVSGLALSDMVDQAYTLPLRAYYSDQQVMVQENENLVIVIDSGTAAQQYVVTAQFQVFRTITGETVFEA